MIDLASAFTDWETQRAFEQDLATGIREGRFSDVEATIAEGLAAYPSSFSALCADVPEQGVEIYPWPRLHVDFVEADDAIRTRHGGRCEVVAIDHVNDNGSPGFFMETGFYAWPPDVARDAPATALLKSPDDTHAKYLWRRQPSHRGSLVVAGLDELVAAQRASPHSSSSSFYGDAAPNDYIGVILANWFILLRLHQSLSRALVEEGLPRSVPVLSGVRRVDWPMETNTVEYGAVLECVYVAPAIVGDADRISEIEAERHARRLEAWNVQTEAILRHLRNHYEQKGWPASRLIPDEVGDYKAYIRGMEDRLEHLQPENLVSRSEFELLLQTVREVRDAGRPTPRVT